MAQPTEFYRHAAISRHLELRAVNVGSLLQLKDSPGAKLNFDAKVSGAGFDLTTMNSRAAIDVLPSQWDVLNVEGGRILAQVAAGRLNIEELRTARRQRVAFRDGNLGLAAPQTRQINYQLQVADLGPWLSMVGRQGQRQLGFERACRRRFGAASDPGLLAKPRAKAWPRPVLPWRTVILCWSGTAACRYLRAR